MAHKILFTATDTGDEWRALEQCACGAASGPARATRRIITREFPHSIQRRPSLEQYQKGQVPYMTDRRSLIAMDYRWRHLGCLVHITNRDEFRPGLRGNDTIGPQNSQWTGSVMTS
jgi:hypothetical protein